MSQPPGEAHVQHESGKSAQTEKEKQQVVHRYSACVKSGGH